MSRSGRDGSQKKLQKVRPPRVQLTYDVEVGDAVEQKEIPFVVGVLGDYGSNPDAVQQKLKDKKFVNIVACPTNCHPQVASLPWT
jgi:type VI secretion system protein ImpB